MVRVVADRAVCIGAGVCVMVADAVFDQDDAGLVVVLSDAVAADCQAQVREAVGACPSGALRLRETDS